MENKLSIRFSEKASLMHGDVVDNDDEPAGVMIGKRQWQAFSALFVVGIILGLSGFCFGSDEAKLIAYIFISISICVPLIVVLLDQALNFINK